MLRNDPGFPGIRLPLLVLLIWCVIGVAGYITLFYASLPPGARQILNCGYSDLHHTSTLVNLELTHCYRTDRSFREVYAWDRAHQEWAISSLPGSPSWQIDSLRIILSRTWTYPQYDGIRSLPASFDPSDPGTLILIHTELVLNW
jgi:hypothetical protein